MQETVYIDVLFMENLVMNFILLKLTGFVVNHRISNVRSLTISLIGTLFTLLLFFLPSRISSNLLVKGIVSLILIAIAFPPKKPIDFIKTTGVFYFACFLLGGTVFGIVFFTKGMRALHKISLKIMVLAVIAALFTMKLLWKTIQSRMYKEKVVAELAVTMGTYTTTFPALVDTGNELKEPISGKPVIIVEYERIRPILDEITVELLGALQCTEVPSLQGQNINTLCEKIYGMEQKDNLAPPNLFFIPFHSVGRADGLLPGLQASSVSIRADGRQYCIEKPMLAVSRQRLNGSREYYGLINPALLETGASKEAKE